MGLMCVGIVLLIFGALMNANIFGTIATIFQQINSKSQVYQERIDKVNASMKNLRIPNNLQDEIRDYMIHTAGSHENQQDLESFLLMLSPKIKNDVTKHIFFDAYRSNDLFKENTQEI